MNIRQTAPGEDSWDEAPGAPSPRPWPQRGWMVAVVLLAIASRLVYCFHRGLGAGLDHLYDDALITLRYASNLAAGLGLVYNPGEVFLGTSSPLYAALMAVPAAFGLDPIWCAVLFNLGCDAAAGVLLVRLGRGLPAFQVLAPLAYLAQANILYWSGTGMEFSLLVLLGFASVAAFAAGRDGLSGLLAAAALVGRLDAAIFLAGFGVVALLERRRIPGRFLAFFLAAAIPWFFYSAWAYGHLVPLSARARYLLYPIQAWSGEAFAVLLGAAWLLPAALGAWLAWSRLATATPGLRFFLRVLSLHPLFFLLAYEATGGRIYRRYQVALDASLVVLGAFALVVLAAQLQEAAGRRRLVAALALAACAVVLARPTVEALRYPWRRLGLPANAVHFEVARWLAANTPADATVMAGNIGYLGYFSQRHIFDIKGLVSPAAYAAMRDGRPIRGLLAVIRPDFVALDPDEFASLESALNDGGYRLVLEQRHPARTELVYRVLERPRG